VNLGLERKRALVTGSTSGIGLAIAKALAAEGAEVWINGRTQQRVDEAVRRLDGNLKGVAADVGTVEGCEVLFSAIPDADILVNNLGIYAPKDFFSSSDDDWISAYELNVLSGVRTTRNYLPNMMSRGWGRILFVTSEAGVQLAPNAVHYGATKAAQQALARGVAEVAAEHGVTVKEPLHNAF
jgi:NAD(P)-dependent dehydrogenase (short-subunit alcohol dehydrogenase family)